MSTSTPSIDSPYEYIVFSSSEAETKRHFPTRYIRLGSNVDVSRASSKDPNVGAKQDEWPTTWPGKCYYDGFEFDGAPFPLILHEDMDTRKFRLSFSKAFCGKWCAFLYLQAFNATEHGRRQLIAFQSFVRNVLKEYEPFNAALPKDLMKAYSPDKFVFETVEDWRKACKRGISVVPVNFPYLPVSMIYEEKVVGVCNDPNDSVFDLAKFNDPPVKARTPAKEIVRKISQKFAANKKLTSSMYVSDKSSDDKKDDDTNKKRQASDNEDVADTDEEVKKSKKPKKTKKSTIVVTKASRKKGKNKESDTDHSKKKTPSKTKSKKGKQPESEPEDDEVSSSVSSEEEVYEEYESESE